MKLSDIFTILQVGRSVADPAAWKTRSAVIISVTTIIGVGVQIAKGYGYDLSPYLSPDNVSAIAGVIAGVVGVWSTYATSDKVGPGTPPVSLDRPTDTSSSS